jgi:Flp pilus assembly protein TadG
MIEFAVVLPILVVAALGVVEIGRGLLHQHVVTKLAREGANLISRDTDLIDAAAALRTMTAAPVDFNNGSTVIFSVLKRGATTGTANFDRLILYQRYTFGSLPATSTIRTAGGAAFGGAPNFEATNSDGNTNLRVTNLPANLVATRGAMLYVTEVFTRYQPLTPLNRFGIAMPPQLYSIAYF